MRQLRTRLGIALGVGLTLCVGLAPVTTAQEDAAASLCAALTPTEVRDTVGVAMEAGTEVDHCEWHSTDFNDPETSVSLSWSPLSLAEHQALADDGPGGDEPQDLTVGGRPALLKAGTIPFFLVVGLDQGTLQISASDTIGTDFSTALVALGELAAGRADTLVPLPVIDTSGLALPQTLRDQPITWSTSFLDQAFPQGDDRRKELRKAVEAQGASLSDITIASGIVYFGDDSVILNAFQVPGADVAKLADFAINASGLWGGYTLPDGITNGSVADVETPSGYQMLLYTNGDTAWTILAEGALADEALAILPGAPTRETIAPPPADEPIEEAPAGLSPADILGDTVAGEAVTVQSQPLGGGFFDPKSRSYKALTKALKANDMELGDVTFTIAQPASQAFGVTAFDVDGADATAFEEFVALSMIEGAQLNPKKVKPEPAEVAGKAVSRLTLKQGGRTALVYVYPQGDVVWVVLTMNDAALAEGILSTLP